MSPTTLIVHDRMPLPARRLVNLVQQILQTAKSPAELAIRGGAVMVNGRVCRRADQLLNVGDAVVVEPPEPSAGLRPRAARDAKTFQVVYQDEHLLVVVKPPRLLTVPTPRQESTTLISLVTAHLRQSARSAEAFCVHRLDRGVSVLLVFGCSLEVAQQLRSQFEARKPDRIYAGIVAGEVRQPEGTFRSFLATDRSTLNQYSTRDEVAGQLAITHYELLQATPVASLVQVRLETGRRNQIRVHFAEAGHPILGDMRYGRQAWDTQLWPHHRLALHAQTLGFTHPVSGKKLSFQSRLPREFDCLRRR